MLNTLLMAHISSEDDPWQRNNDVCNVCATPQIFYTESKYSIQLFTPDYKIQNGQLSDTFLHGHIPDR